MNFMGNKVKAGRAVNTKHNKVKIAEVLQLVLLLIPVFKLSRKILKDRKMK
ncbi:hypothetical protein [Streptococcus porcinus]|uniref:Uncharacterized protein n=2 Tax=Streptococcus porcinus TaxID=1340 RepID=A0A4V6LYA9_STRPO|nr:hypothetical protein [Streptococcus porcinus]EGJ28335.1 hypothetical protein STRPO_0380 [Streptococcus porcinus str. Jelinkova 176]SQG44149.1 Uncharacterised protein [Streptococcus porcinus]VTT43599.1 Uncharacterised protein [Streptococcus porcinus]VTT45001.1 Uncharacterised protein [Streptococcus porcinus]